MKLYSLLLLSLLCLMNIAKNVDNNVDNSRHLIELSPNTIHKSLSKRDTNQQDSIATDIDKSSSIFNTYLRDIPLLYENLSDVDNEVVLFSIPDYDIHKLNYKIWQYPRVIDPDMTPIEKEVLIRENIIDFINDYVVNLKNDVNVKRGNDLKNVLVWLENNNNFEMPLTLVNENGKNLEISKKMLKNGKNQLIMANGHEIMAVDLIYNGYSNGVIFVIKGCFDKKIWN
ncbi:hypothetical protein DAHU10_016220 [Hanseniaspora uvarum]|nr:hypothetical protein DAHU10_016220 [Hanseniaspora uvarum]